MSLKIPPIRVIVIFAVAVAFLIIAIVLFCNYKTEIIQEVREDYTNCKGLLPTPCKDQNIQPDSPCVCIIPFEINETIVGSVGLYYELATYSQDNSDYRSSKDDKQLMGILSATPAATCGDYSYLKTPDGQKKPIAPCGAIADSMFIDQFTLQNGSEEIGCIDTGLYGITDDDRKLYHNPPGDLKEALKDFAKPKTWVRNLWELDTENASNNGFQNEAFIAWMKTDLRRKPICRVDPTGEFEKGLPAGNYNVRVDISYPFTTYSGPRIIIIASNTYIPVYRTTILVMAIICLIVALALVGVAYVVKLRY